MNHHFFFATLQMNPTKVTTSVPIIPVKIPEIVTEFVPFQVYKKAKEDVL